MLGDSRYRTQATTSKPSNTQRNQIGPLGHGPFVTMFHQNSEKLISGWWRREKE